MKKAMKKVAVFLVGVCLLVSLVGCGEKFDASAYLKAILDNSYLNDSTAFVEQGIGTAEEAAALYEKEIDAEMETMLSSVALSEELQEEYRSFYSDMFGKVKYTVGEAVEVDENTIEVTVTYEKMNVFVAAMDAYKTKAAALVEEWSAAALTGTAPTDEQMLEYLFATLLECMQETLNNATYEAPTTMTVRVELNENVWTPNQEDLLTLEYALFDFEGLETAE